MNAQNTKSRILATAAAVVGTFGLAVAAHAGDAHGPSGAKYDDVVVRYGDLNLATEEGARTLYARLSTAAERACGHEPKSRAPRERARYRACFDAAMTRAVDEVGSRQLHALHAARTESSVG